MKPVAGLKIERALICSIADSRRCRLRSRGMRRARNVNRRRRLPTLGRCATIRPFYHRRSTMKIGMNLLLWTTPVTEEHFPLFAKLKEAGYDGVELPLFEGDTAHYRKIGQELKNQGLACTAVSVVGPEHNPISPDAKVRQAAVDRHKWAIDMLAACGGDILCGPYHSPLGVFSRTRPTADEKKRAAAVLRKAADVAKAPKINPAIQYHNRCEGYFS